MAKFKPLACLALAMVLSACGGGGSSSGGGGGSPEPEPEPAPEPEPTPPEQTPVFSISGQLNVPANLVADSDNNNPEIIQRGNDTVGSAQPIANPTTLGGYVSQPQAGEPGAAQAAGDIDDYFRVDLLAGQSVTLLVADFEQADADLYLMNEQGEVLDFSVASGQLESVSIPVDGTYIVNVFSFAGATNYVMAIGSNNSRPNQQPRGEIIPWEAVVEYRSPESGESDTDLEVRLRGSMALRARANGHRRGPGRRKAQLLGMERSVVSVQQQSSRLGTARERLNRIQDPNLRARWETLMTVKSLRSNPDVHMAEPNYRVYALAEPNDEAYPFQWHYPLVNLPAAWDLTTGQPDVQIAVLDTGILSNHPDMAGQLVPGYDFIADPRRAGDGDGIDANPEDAGDGGELGRDSYHGTHVSGTVAAASDNGIGVAGVAWDARIMPLRVLGIQGGSTYDVAQAMRYAAGLDNDSGTVPERPADIINLSLGGGPFIASIQSLIDEVRAAGVIIVAAAGNEGSDRPAYPASYDGVISVSAVDSQRNLAPYSNFGSRIDVAAPGGNNAVDRNGDGYPDGVLSTRGSTSDSGGLNFVYTFTAGTSMASPHVAGIVALMKSVNPALTPEDVDALLASGDISDDLGSPGRDNLYGAGLVNAERAVVAALTAAGATPADNPRLGASSALLNFGSTTQALDLVLQNSGRGTLRLNTVRTSQPWLSASPLDVDDNGLGTYRVEVTRDDLSVGTYAAELTAVSDVNTLTINILLSVAASSTGGDVGLVYLLLVDSATQELVAQFDASRQRDNYRFAFADIPAGSYEFIAGTDADNDLFICDPGEACGAYLTLDQPVLVDLQTNLEGVSFPVEYRVTIPNIASSHSSNSADALRRNLAAKPRRR